MRLRERSPRAARGALCIRTKTAVFVALAFTSLTVFSGISWADPVRPVRAVAEASPAGFQVAKPRSAAKPAVIRAIPTPEKVVALTIDDGPDPRWTPAILDLLESEGVRATFFVVGARALAYPELIRREVREGHEVENHTFSHPDLLVTDMRNTQLEILRNEAVIEKLAGRRPLFFRPPKGLADEAVNEAINAHGYRIARWTVGVEQHGMGSMAEAARVLGKLRPGAIILAHDGGVPNRGGTLLSLPLVIRGIKSQGYRFVTLEELVRLKGVVSAESRAATAGGPKRNLEMFAPARSRFAGPAKKPRARDFPSRTPSPRIAGR